MRAFFSATTAKADASVDNGPRGNDLDIRRHFSHVIGISVMGSAASLGDNLARYVRQGPHRHRRVRPILRGTLKGGRGTDA